MKKIGTQSNKVYYQKTQAVLRLINLMQTSEKGISIQEIENEFKVSSRTAVRMKDTIKSQFPNIKSTTINRTKYWSIPQGTLSVNIEKSEYKPVEKSFNNEHNRILEETIKKTSEILLLDKIKELFYLGKKAGYSKLTDKQLVIAYYGRYTTFNKNDRKNLSDIREALSKLPSSYKEMIDND